MESEAKLGLFALLCLSLPAAAVQVGWTVGESLIIPHLLSLGASGKVANIAFLLNPVVGLFAQPWVGHASDNCKSSLGRRRPFLLAFHFGSIIGLLTVVFAGELLELIGIKPVNKEGLANSDWMIVIIMAGFALADMSHDLLLMPARALLNDSLPEEQTDQGNSVFALVSMLGSMIGLGLVIAPMDQIPPFSMLGSPIRATFVAASAIVLLSNLLSFFISRNIDHPAHCDEDEYGEDEPSGEESMSFDRLRTLVGVLPRPLIFIWVSQVMFWLAVLPVNIWVSSFVSVELIQASSPEAGVRYGALGLLIQSIIAFGASSLISRANASFGLTNIYHASAILYGGSICSLWWKPSYPVFLIIMAISGVALPALYSSPFTLIEVHASDDDDMSDDDEPDHYVHPEPTTPPKEQHQLSTRPSTHINHFSYHDGTESPHSPLQRSPSVYTMSFLDEWRGILTGVFNLCMIVAQIVIGLSSGALVDLLGDISVIFVIFGSIAALFHAVVLVCGLSKPVDESAEEEEDEEVSPSHQDSSLATKEAARTPLLRIRVDLPPLVDYGALSSRAGRLRSGIVLPPPRHVRHISTSENTSAEKMQDRLKRSTSAPSLVLLSRPSAVVRGVPVFGSHGMPRTSDRNHLERLRERTRLFNRRSATHRRASSHAHVSEQDSHEHERRMWFMGRDQHLRAAEEQKALGIGQDHPAEQDYSALMCYDSATIDKLSLQRSNSSQAKFEYSGMPRSNSSQAALNIVAAAAAVPLRQRNEAQLQRTSLARSISIADETIDEDDDEDNDDNDT